MKKILISRTDGIGDLLLATPLIKAVKDSAHKPYTAVLASRYAAPVLVNNPAVDEVITYQKGDEKNIIKKIKAFSFDCAIAAYARPETAWLLFMAGIKERYGTANRWYSPFLFNRRVNVSRKKSEHHEADYNLMLARDVCGQAAAEREYLYLSDKEIQGGKDYVLKKGLGKGFVIVHPGSKGSAWNISEEKYGEIISLLCSVKGRQVLLTGGPAEQDKLQRIKISAGSPESLVIMNEAVELRDFAAVIAASSCLISSSTGPMHMAAALGVKTLSFFPPDSIPAMASRRWRPLGNIQEIIKPAREAKTPREAMETISAEDVICRLDALFRESK